MDNLKFESDLTTFVQNSCILRPEFSHHYFRWPILNEDTASTPFDEQYLYHINWALKKISTRMNPLHIDFSSSLNFISPATLLTNVIYYDYRPPNLTLSNLSCFKTDLSEYDTSIQPQHSVSCMHVVEHIGLGRYGDRIDPNGDLKAIDNLARYVAAKGTLLFVVPVGRPAVYFNAHRVYSPKDIVRYFSNFFLLKEFYFIPSNLCDKPVVTSDLDLADKFQYACGCFEFERKI